MSIDVEQLATILIAIIGYLVAYYQKQKTATAQAETQAVQDFFDPASAVTEVPANTPTRSYQMSDSVKQFLLVGETAQDQATMEAQIIEAEAAGKIKYTVTYSKGYYIIEYGQITGGAKGD